MPFVLRTFQLYVLWFQLMKLLGIVPVNYPSSDLFGGKMGMLTKVQKGSFITSFPVSLSQLHRWTDPVMQWLQELLSNTENIGRRGEPCVRSHVKSKVGTRMGASCMPRGSPVPHSALNPSPAKKQSWKPFQVSVTGCVN